jgi:uncharacterized protein
LPARNSKSARGFGNNSSTSSRTSAGRPDRSPSPSRKDPDDDKFLECADAAGADYLVTGNQRHFPKFWKKTKVITSRELVSIAAPHLIP